MELELELEFEELEFELEFELEWGISPISYLLSSISYLIVSGWLKKEDAQFGAGLEEEVAVGEAVVEPLHAPQNIRQPSMTHVMCGHMAASSLNRPVVVINDTT